MVADALLDEICTLAAQVNAASAELARLVAAYDQTGAWNYGLARSCGHTLSYQTGLLPGTANELSRVGLSLGRLPAIAQAFAQGRLSLDQVRLLCGVAEPADEEMWLELALSASPGQLARMAREFRRMVQAQAADPASERSLHMWFQEGGMLRLTALLRPEEGALVKAAIEKATGTLLDQRGDQPEPIEAIRADALVEVCRNSGGAGLPPRVLLHVDASEFGARLDDGPRLDRATARRLACDSETAVVVHRGGTPHDVGRSRRTIPPRLRTALQARDRTCRFPGCAVPAAQAEGHHLVHWADGGATRLDNLLTLCRYHHRRLHEGLFQMRSLDDGMVVFEHKGRAIAPQPPPPLDGHGLEEWVDVRDLHIDAKTTRCLDGGRLDLDYAMAVIGESSARLRAASESRGP